jgi:hypothetical protein
MRIRKIAVSAVGVAAIVLGSAAAVHAATGAADTDDHFNLANTAVTGKLPTGGSLVFVGTLSGLTVTVTCKGFSASGTTPKAGVNSLSVAIAPPKFSSCTDKPLGGTDTITTNKTNGNWSLAENDAANDETAKEPNPTVVDKATLTIPKAGVTFFSSVFPSCHVTIAPTAAAKVTGTYNDKGTIVVKNAKIAVSTKGCTSGSTATINGTIVLSKPLYDAG